MAAMNECLEIRFFGALPESWRVRAFFRFFSGWSSLLAQQHAVEVAVHCDWLGMPTGDLPSDFRQELLSYQRDIEMQAMAVGRMMLWIRCRLVAQVRFVVVEVLCGWMTFPIPYWKSKRKLHLKS